MVEFCVRSLKTAISTKGLKKSLSLSTLKRTLSLRRLRSFRTLKDLRNDLTLFRILMIVDGRVGDGDKFSKENYGLGWSHFPVIVCLNVIHCKKTLMLEAATRVVL